MPRSVLRDASERPPWVGRRPRLALEWASLCTLLGAIGVLLGLGLRADREALLEAQRTRLEHQAKMVEQLLGGRLQAASNALDALRDDAQDLLASEDGAARLSDRMRVMVASMTGVRTFVLVDVRGAIIASNRPELLGGDWREGERYRTISRSPDASRLYLSPPFRTPLGNWALSLGRAIVQPGGRFGGYFLAIIDPEYFRLLLDSLRYAPDMSAALIHGRGKVIYRMPDSATVEGVDLSKDPGSAFTRHAAAGRPISTWTVASSPARPEALEVFMDIRPAVTAADGRLVASLSRQTAAVLAPWRRELRDRIAALAAFGLVSALGLHLLQRRRAERRRQEQARLDLLARSAESQKLESIGRLAGGVAHDFNNLLTVILSSGDEGQREARQGRPAAPEVFEEIMSAAERAADLTRQLLAFARRQVVVPATLDLNEQLRSSQKLLRRVIGEDVRVEERLQPDLWPVRCDPGLFGQVVLNLSVNARDAMPAGGTLTVTTQNLAVAQGDPVLDPAMAPGDYVLLKVEDSGTGMTREVAEHLFEPFFTTKGPGRGTGLGLATVYGIVKQSGAHIGVRSTLGQGTTFEIAFPRQVGEAPPPPARAEPSTGGGHETILLADDEPGVRAAVAQALRAAGYQVLTAASVEEAVAQAEAARGAIHLLITDVVMPGARGPELARRVAAGCPGLRVLYISGHPQDPASGAELLGPEVEFLAKPFAPERLRTRVREVLDRATGATQAGRPGTGSAEVGERSPRG